jgi:hypothetical protein
MDKDFKEFGKYLSLLLAIYFINETLRYYIPLNFSSKYAWIGAIAFAFLFYLASK